MQYELAFMGCGNMGGTLLKAAAKTLSPERIAAFDPDEKKLSALTEETGAVAVSLQTAAKDSRFFVVGVKPQVLSSALKEPAAILRDRADVTLVSMAAGVSISDLRKAVGKDLPVIRIMPNTPASIGKGVILYAADGVSEGELQAFLSAFSGAGILDPVAEEKMDAASALSGCGPAFCYLFLEALADGAVECGVPRDKALFYAAKTLEGAAAMVETFGNPGALKDAVCSPGGTTIAGVHALEEGGFRAAAMNAVVAAYEKTLRLKK